MTQRQRHHRLLSILLLVAVAALLRFALTPLLEFHSIPMQLVAAGVIVSIGALYVLRGAAIVALMGGIFLGGSSLILIFVVILTLNTTLIWQIAKLKNSLLLETVRTKH